MDDGALVWRSAGDADCGLVPLIVGEIKEVCSWHAVHIAGRVVGCGHTRPFSLTRDKNNHNKHNKHNKHNNQAQTGW